MTTKTAESAAGKILSHLSPVRRLDGVTGIVVATMDGRAVLTDLDEQTPGAAAAITASSIGLGGRLGELGEREAKLLELQVRSDAGYVCLYVINTNHLLAVVATHAVNLARLKLETRDVLVALDGILPVVSHREGGHALSA